LYRFGLLYFLSLIIFIVYSLVIVFIVKGILFEVFFSILLVFLVIFFISRQLKTKIFQIKLERENLEEEINIVNTNIGKKKRILNNISEQLLQLDILESLASSLLNINEPSKVYELLASHLVRVFSQTEVVLFYGANPKTFSLELAFSLINNPFLKLASKKGDLLDNF
jgi:c-di-AMP phosphodiesterase-like protein